MGVEKKLLDLEKFYYTRNNMKTRTCKQLGGACDEALRAETFDGLAELSRAHGMKMFSEGDKAHVEVIEAMIKMMADPDKMQKWVDEKKALFASLDEES